MSASTTADYADYPSYPDTNNSINTSSINTGRMNATTNDSLQNAKNSVVNNSTAAYNAVANHPLTQNVKDTVANGPVAENAKEQAVKTQNEFSNLAAARTTPSQPAATGQPLTHYHSFFSSLLSWENPRASAIAYVAVVLFIFGARYLNLLRYAFKLTWMTLGVTIAAEIAGRTLFSQGLASQLRPRKYYTMPRETLDSMIGDVHELVNFFIIESQRIVFAENVFASAAVCAAAFLSYYLIKIVPFWGMCLIGTSVMFLVPLLYLSNQELIDHHIRHTSNIVNQQTEQVKQIATHHASVAAKTTQQYASDYTAKAQEMVGVKPSRSSSPEVAIKPIKTEPVDSSFNSANSASNPFGKAATNSAGNSFANTAASTTTNPFTDSAANLSANSTSNLGSNSVNNFTAGPDALSYKPADFPVAPKEDFKTTTAPTVGSTASTLRDEQEPLFVA